MTEKTGIFSERVTPDNATVLFIDHQTGLMNNVLTIDPIVLKNNVMALGQMAKVFNLPVVLTTSGVAGQNGPFLGELRAMFPANEVVDRTLINAWDDPKFVDAVKQTGRKKLLMAGITTDVCLAFPAIQAVAAGYDVYAILDASGTWNSLIEQAAMMRMAQAGVKLTTWVAISAELQRDWATPTGPSLGQLYFDRLAPYSFLLESHHRQA